MCLDDPEQLIHAQIELLTQRIEAREPRREGSPKKRQSPRRSMRRSLRRRRTAKWPSAPTVQGFQDPVLARAWGFVFTSSYRPVRVAEAKAKAKAKAEAQAKAKAEDSWGLGFGCISRARVARVSHVQMPDSTARTSQLQRFEHLATGRPTSEIWLVHERRRPGKAAHVLLGSQAP